MLHLALKNGVTSAVTNQQRAVCSTPFIFIDQLNRFIDNPDTTVILYDNSVWPHFIVICKYLHIVVQNEQTTEWVHILYVPMWKLGLCNITYVGCITPILSTFFEPNTSLKGWISIGLDSNFPLWFTDMLYATNMIHIGEHHMDRTCEHRTKKTNKKKILHENLSNSGSRPCFSYQPWTCMLYISTEGGMKKKRRKKKKKNTVQILLYFLRI